MIDLRKACMTLSASTLAVAASAIIGWTVLVTVGWQLGLTSTIFVERDVAMVYLLSVLPMGSFLAMHIQQRRSAMISMTVAILSLAASLPMLSSASIESVPLSGGLLDVSLIRTATAFGLALPTLLLVATFLSRSKRTTRPLVWKAIVGVVIGILAATVLPAIYVQARCRHDLLVLGELLDQSRLGEARAQAHEVLRMAPSIEWRERPLGSFAQKIDRNIRDLESQVAGPLPEHATNEHRLARCRQLAMLGRTSEALPELTPLLDSEVGPAACDLCGTIYETTAHWEVARDYHHRAKDGWLSRPSTSERDAGILQAATRLGYCERKLGHYDLAEAEYGEVLARSPTAQTHFLLARFYEDMQQSAKARSHARRAMALAPERYQREGTKLIDKLMIGHFGCLGVFSAELAEDRSTMSPRTLSNRE